MENLKIVMMNGGLGNQLYQYTFLRFLEKTTGETCIIDDSAFWGNRVEHNGLELEKIFGVKLNKLSDCFSSDVWEEMVLRRAEGISIPQQLLDNGLNITMIAESDTYKFNGNVISIEPRRINEEILNVFINAKGNIYYFGYFVNMTYINLMLNTLRKELRFPVLRETLEKDTINVRYAELISLTNSVAMHIRRGDFLKCGRSVSADKYAKAVKIFEEKNGEYTYFVFSDDIKWCKENKKELGLLDIKGDFVFVEENIGNGNNYIDMQLMSYCKNMIISNSSFGCWAYFLNPFCSGENMIMVDKL